MTLRNIPARRGIVEPPRQTPIHQRAPSAAAALSASLLCAACALNPGEIPSPSLLPADDASTAAITTGSIASSPTPAAGAARSPASASLSEAARLRALGRKEEAAGLLEQAAAAEPGNHDVKVSRGLIALEMGRLDEARKILTDAEASGPPDWRVLSGLGSVHAAEGRQKDAQTAYAKALRLKPDHPSILNNLALSYALDGKRERAEAILRRAAADGTALPQTKQNLALLLGLQGRKDEASRIAQAVLPKPKAEANMGYLEELRASIKVSKADDPKPTRTAAVD